MNCSQARKMISPYVDDELTPDERKAFTSHIQECLGCKEKLEEIQGVHRLFASTERFEAPLGFATRVMTRVEEEEEGIFARLWRVVTGGPAFLRAVEVAFALVIVIIGVVSGNLLVSDRTPGRQATVQESFSLDLFEATPPGSIGGAYVKLTGANDER
jgi:anti-sigma factor RsiW